MILCYMLEDKDIILEGDEINAKGKSGLWIEVNPNLVGRVYMDHQLHSIRRKIAHQSKALT